MELEAFNKLEENVKKLLETRKPLEAENKELKRMLDLREVEVRGLRKRLKKFEDEKGLLKDRVDGLLQRLDGIIHNV